MPTAFSVTYKRKFLISISPKMESETEEIGITLNVHEGEKAAEVLAAAKKFVLAHATCQLPEDLQTPTVVKNQQQPKEK